MNPNTNLTALCGGGECDLFAEALLEILTEMGIEAHHGCWEFETNDQYLDLHIYVQAGGYEIDCDGVVDENGVKAKLEKSKKNLKPRAQSLKELSMEIDEIRRSNGSQDRNRSTLKHQIKQCIRKHSDTYLDRLTPKN